MPLRLRFRVPTFRPAATGPGAARSSRRRFARAAIGFGALAFFLLTFALAVTVETVKPQWRDPEYGYRLQQALKWQREWPERPLVMVVGSSRAQMAVSPSHMGFADEPGSPRVCNFGYRSAAPVTVFLQVQRAWADGLRPRAVVLFLTNLELNNAMPAEELFHNRTEVLSGRDLEYLAPYTHDSTTLRRAVLVNRLNPWPVRASALAGMLPADCRSPESRNRNLHWETMDQYGFMTWPAAQLTPEFRRRAWADARTFAPGINNFPVSEVSDRAIRDLVAWCRARDVAVAAVWAPESPAFRGLYEPQAWDARDAYTRTLAGELGIPVFPALNDLAEDDFVDGFHLTLSGAAKYSRWLASNYLQPWLATPK